jgi:hypothetical protein
METNFKYSSNQRTLIEALMIELIKFTDTKDISQIIEDIKELRSAGSSSFGEEKIIEPPGAAGKSAGEVKITPSETPEPPSSENPPEAAGQNRAVDLTDALSDINSHWTSIKDQIKSERKWVYSIIKDSTCVTPPKDEKSRLVIQVDDSTYELVDGYRDYLSGKASKYFGQTLSVNLVKSSDFVSSSTHDEKPEKNKAPDAEENYEKIRALLIKELNAKEIN